MRARLLAVAVLGLALLCASLGRAADPHGQEGAVLEAVLRHQISLFLDDEARARRTVICLGIDPGEAPQGASREFLARFKEPLVRSLGECERRGSGAVEGVTRAAAVLVTAGPIDWVADDEAWVRVTHFRSKRDSAMRTYRVVRDPSGWVSLGPIYRDGPV